MQSYLIYLSTNNYKKKTAKETSGHNFLVTLKLIGIIQCKEFAGEFFGNNDLNIGAEPNRSQKLVIQKHSPEETESIGHLTALSMYSDDINILKCEQDNIQLNFSSITSSSSSTKRSNKNINWLITGPYYILLNGLIQVCTGIGTLPRPVSDNYQRQKILTICSESKLLAVTIGNESTANTLTASIMFQLFNNDPEQGKQISTMDNRKYINQLFNIKSKSLSHIKKLNELDEYIIYYNDKKTNKRPVGLIHGQIKQQKPVVPVDLQNMLEKIPIHNVINVEEAESTLCLNKENTSFNNDRKYVCQHSSLIKLKLLTGSAFVYNFRREFLFYLEKNSTIFMAGYVGLLKKSQTDDAFYARPISGCQTIQYNGSCILFIGNHYLFILEH